jgi:hypothetical protein
MSLRLARRTPLPRASASPPDRTWLFLDGNALRRSRDAGTTLRLPLLAVAVEIAELGEALADGGEVAEQPPDGIRALRRIRHLVWQQAQLVGGAPAQRPGSSCSRSRSAAETDKVSRFVDVAVLPKPLEKAILGLLVVPVPSG